MILKSVYAPNVLRLAYDVLVGIFVAAIVYVYMSVFKTMDTSFVLFALAPVAGILYFFVSRFSGIRVPKLLIQILVLGCAIVLSALAMYASGISLDVIFLFHVFLFPLLAAPRYFLNLKRNQNTLISKLGLKNKGSVLIVGGAGYIGTHLIDILLKKKYSVRVLDRLAYGASTLESFRSDPHFEFIEGDATEIGKLVAALTDCSVVVHLGGLVGDPACAVDENFTRHENVIATRMVKEVAKAAGVGRFIFASSCSVYGANDNIVDESTPLSPVSLYAKTKIDSETELSISNDEDFHVTILRFATVFGHSLRPRFDLVVNLFSAQAYNDGKITVMGSGQWRPFVHCRDIARAVEKVIAAPAHLVHGETFNVGDDQLNTTIGGLSQMVVQVAKDFGKDVEILVNDESPDRRNYRVSFAKIKKILNFESEYSLQAGIQEIFKNFQAGNYKNYKDMQYSNLETTKQQVGLFYDPMHTDGMYRPVNESVVSARS